MGSGGINQLFVVSPYVDADWLGAAAKAGSKNTIVSTALLLPEELSALQRSGAEYEVRLLAGFFADATLAAFDDEIAATLDEIATATDAADVVDLAHVEVTMRAVGSRRNRAAAEIIRKEQPRIDRVYLCAGPNVTAHPWLETFRDTQFTVVPPAGDPHTTPPAAPKPFPSVVPSGDSPVYATNSIAALHRTRTLSPTNPPGPLLELESLSGRLRSSRFRRLARAAGWHGKFRHFAAQQKRLAAFLDSKPLPPNVDRVPLQAACSEQTLVLLERQTALCAEAKRRGAVALVESMHAFLPLDGLAARLAKLKPVVLQDGYLPVNYPRGIYGPYRKTHFVFWSPAARTWGGTAGLHGGICRPAFEAGVEQGTPPPESGPVRVLALLGHGGEWTSLIFRSDIDLLVRDLIATARLRPEMRFRLRAHPTMLHEGHDGWNSLARLRRHIGAADLPNLAISDGPLEADIDWANFAVSEYSLSLLEFVARNPGGIATYNPTRRRDFFREFTVQGLPQVVTPEQLAALLDRLPRSGRTALKSFTESPTGPLADVIAGLGETDPAAKAPR